LPTAVSLVRGVAAKQGQNLHITRDLLILRGNNPLRNWTIVLYEDGKRAGEFLRRLDELMKVIEEHRVTNAD